MTCHVFVWLCVIVVRCVGNDFNWIGESAMTAYGSTSHCLNANCSIKLPGLVGPDGRNGNQPRGTRVVGNLVREFGLWQKQSSAWAQQLTAESWIEGNVMFNSPRAAINFVRTSTGWLAYSIV